MPSSIYESVKKSVIEFKQNKKRNEKLEQKMIFRWKLITLALSILLIVMLGLFSQLIKSLNSLPTYQGNTTFLVELIEQSADNDLLLSSVPEITNLITGISLSATPDFARASRIYSATNNPININEVMNQINGRANLVYLFTDDLNSKFGIYISETYRNNTTQNGDQMYSTLFSLNSPYYYDIAYNKQSTCSNYVYDSQQQTLKLLQAIIIKDSDIITLEIASDQYSCYGTTLQIAQSEIASLANIDFGGQPTYDITLKSFQIYALYN